MAGLLLVAALLVGGLLAARGGTSDPAAPSALSADPQPQDDGGGADAPLGAEGNDASAGAHDEHQEDAADGDVTDGTAGGGDVAAPERAAADADRPVLDSSLLASADSMYAAGIAAAVSQQIFPNGGAEEVVLIRAGASGDALAAGSLIGLFDTTFLITDSEALPAVTAAEIDRLGTPRVHILGGPAAISPEIEAQLLAAGHNVHRHAGPAQADTAVNIAQAHFPTAQTAVLLRTPDRTAGPVEVIASALAATTLAAAQDMPILLTDGHALSSSTEQHLASAQVRQVIVVGSEAEISDDVTVQLRQLGVDWTRWGGEGRFANAVEIARNRGFDSLQGADAVVLVEGGHDSVWPAGFLGSVLAARENGPVLLSDGAQLPPATATYLEANASTGVEVLCTPGVTEQACARAREVLGGSSR